MNLSPGRRRTCEVFVVANMAKPSYPEASAVILALIEQLLKDVASWTDEEVYRSVTDEARRKRFAESSWRRTTVELTHLAVWPRMGGLPSIATRGSVIDTADYILKCGIPTSADRLRPLVDAARSDPNGIERVCRALPLIAVDYGMLRQDINRSAPWALDDGSHRAIALALISPQSNIDILVGTREELP